MVVEVSMVLSAKNQPGVGGVVVLWRLQSALAGLGEHGLTGASGCAVMVRL
jgi:hypothetical protein